MSSPWLSRFLLSQKAPFFVTKLGIKMLPCVIFFSNGVAFDRIIGFEELGGRDDFPTSTFERRLRNAGALHAEISRPLLPRCSEGGGCPRSLA